MVNIHKGLRDDLIDISSKLIPHSIIFNLQFIELLFSRLQLSLGIQIPISKIPFKIMEPSQITIMIDLKPINLIGMSLLQPIKISLLAQNLALQPIHNRILVLDIVSILVKLRS